MATYRELLAWGSAELSHLERRTHESALLLASAAGLTKEKLFARLTDEAPDDAHSRYRSWIEKRAGGRPVAYLLGEKEFYGRSFLTDPRALIPRPDTELLVEAALAVAEDAQSKTPGDAPLRIHDCCTGTGCVAITLALELPSAELSASDISAQAIELARENGSRLAPGSVGFSVADLLSGIEAESLDIITANPPYLSTEETRDVLSQGWGEPAIALDGGVSGLDIIGRLIDEAMVSLRRNGYILIEAADHQAAGIRTTLRRSGFRDIETVRDLAGRQRVTVGRYG